MTDQPGRPPEERLPAPRPSSAPVPADALLGAAVGPPQRPDAGARRAGSSASPPTRGWVGFLAVTIVALFVIGYYFYEVGLPGGLTEPRLDAGGERAAGHGRASAATTSTRPTARSATASTARAASGPTLNEPGQAVRAPQPGLPAQHAHGRAAGTPAATRTSIMPVWSNTGNPPGPLNYKQIDDLIAFIRASQGGHVPRPGPQPVRAGHRPDDRASPRPSGLGGPELQARPRAPRRSRTAGQDAFKTPAAIRPAPSAARRRRARPAPRASAGPGRRP